MSRAHVVEVLQQEVSSADQQKQVQILLDHMPYYQHSSFCWICVCNQHASFKKKRKLLKGDTPQMVVYF